MQNRAATLNIIVENTDSVEKLNALPKAFSGADGEWPDEEVQ